MKKPERRKKSDWIPVPERSAWEWFSDFLVSSMVLGSWHSKKGSPKFLRSGLVRDKKSSCGCKCHKGEALVDYEVRWK